MSKLNIYRASAGSGKTYTLTGEYLNLLFENPNNYKNILAVTFTNKATDEMKSRILKEINSLAKGEKSGYADSLKERYKISDIELQQKAGDILQRLLHDYSRFSVTTIDSFFQKVIKHFAREIGLQVGFNIELDQNKILEKVVDNLFLELDNDANLKKWLTDFVESKIREGKSWNFKKDIFELGTEVFKEDFKSFNKILIQKLSDKKFLTSYRESLIKIKKEFQTRFENWGDEARQLIENQGLSVNDFPYTKSGFAGYLTKLGNGSDFEPKKRVREALDNIEKWSTKTASQSTKAAIQTAYNNGLNEIIRETINYYDEQYLLYNSADKTLNYIYTLGILTDISRKIQEYTNNENIFLLSDAVRFLRDIIDNNETPFIYEKIGNTYKHFMIDEFQDTSQMQWDNFRPLINNSLSENKHSLVVGDVKQSIYRWRNGDWKLLAEQLEEDFNTLGTENHTLNYNWRSHKNIIDFNNTFYSVAVQALQNHYNNDIPEKLQETLIDEQQKILHAYRDVHQHFPENNQKHGGYIRSQFIPTDEDDNWTEQALKNLPPYIEELQNKNYKAGDIAILVRNAKEGKTIADFLIKYKNSPQAKPQYNYDLISNDSLYLKNSSAINLLAHLLKYLVNPNEPINCAFIAQEYQRYILNKTTEDADQLYNREQKTANNLKTLLPDEFINRVNELKRLSLYDTVEQLITLFQLHDNSDEYPYLQAFQDLILNYSNDKTPDLASFINWWDERKQKEVISVSDQQDAIRILTIHKSKGLEFKTVIIPFCNWELDNSKHANILWCKPKAQDFNKLDVIPVRYGSGLKDTIYYKDYFTEKLKSYVDNINLLYVATTRAKENLYISSPMPKKQEMRNIADLILHTFGNSENYPKTQEKSLIKLSEKWDDQTKCFQYGALPSSKKETHTAQKTRMEKYPANLLDNRLKLKSHAEDYFDFSETKSVDSIAPINRGNILHQLFQLINYSEDLNKAVQQLQSQGKLNKTQAAEVSNFASNLLKSSEVSNWFSHEWKIITERNILLGNQQTLRPDRVITKGNKAIVIDYKFGLKKSETHLKQVQNYVSVVQKMGFQEVEGYVLYGKLDQMIKV